MDNVHRARVLRAFRERFGEPDLVVRGPGRVNLIGEHTDYNDGFVLPAAVDKAIWVALRRRHGDVCRLHAVDLGEAHEARLSALERGERAWPRYLLGVLAELRRDGHPLGGLDCAFGGDVPIGSGLSSSAAVECAFALGCDALFGLGYDRVALAKLGQRSENEFVGVACGIMDQFASLLGRAGCLIRLDCRDLSRTYVPFERADLSVVLCDSQVRRSLATSEYNLRRAQCEAGVRALARHAPHVTSLRDVTPELLFGHGAELDAVVRRRCAYVIAENARVLSACDALAGGDFSRFGQLLDASHEGLARDYEVSCPELDLLAEAARALPGVLGARMMGAGFGGCTINLVEERALGDFAEGMERACRDGLGKPAVLHVCRLEGGAEVSTSS